MSVIDYERRTDPPRVVIGRRSYRDFVLDPKSYARLLVREPARDHRL
jgi:hypothetical protein